MKKIISLGASLLIGLLMHAQQDEQLQALVIRYSTEIDQNKRYADQDYINRILDREMTILATFNGQKKNNYIFKVNDQTAEFMQQRCVDAETFCNADSLLIQHLITKEIVGIVESSVATFHKNSSNPALTTFVQHVFDLAIIAQQLNQQGKITQAITITDCCHFFRLYQETIVDGAYDSQTLEIAVKNLGKALYSYVAFAEQLYNAPKTILQELQGDFDQLADLLQGVIAVIENENDIQSVDTIHHHEQQDGLVTSLLDCRHIVAENRDHEKLTASLLLICALTKSRLQQINQVIDQNVPADVRRREIGFGKTPEGEIVVFAEQ